jgi:hypothetical protein
MAKNASGAVRIGPAAATQEIAVKNVDNVTLTVTLYDNGKSPFDPPELSSYSLAANATVPDPGDPNAPPIELVSVQPNPPKYMVNLTIADAAGQTTYFPPQGDSGDVDVTGLATLEVKKAFKVDAVTRKPI